MSLIEQLNPTDKVYLKQRYISRGNVFFQGHYKVAELPKAILTEEYINVLGKEETPKNYQTALKKQVIQISTTTPTTKQVSYNKPSSSKPQSTSKLNINKATAEELTKLTNVTTAIATKIIDAREKKQFSDLENLKERIKLNRGNWDDHKDRLLFEKKKT